MGQDLRVAAWLRFGNKAQLAKGLRAFAQYAPSEYYDAGSWELDEQDATLRLDVELPGDFTDVERAFMEMIRAAAFGYVDYFERGNDKIHAGRGARGPIKRWAVGQIPQKIILPYGTMSLGYAGEDEELLVTGSFRYADEALPRKLAGARFRLPYLRAKGARELRLGPEIFRVSGSELGIEAVITGPAAALEEPLVELLRLLGAKAVSGVMTFQGSRGQTRVEAKGKARSSLVSKAIVASAGATRVATVDAAEPLAAVAAPEPAAAPAGKRGAKKGKAGEEGMIAFPAEHGRVAGATLLSGERLLTWGGGRVSVARLGDLGLVHGYSCATEFDPTFSWPVLGVTELPGDRAVVFHEMNGDLDLLNLATGERRIIQAHGHSVYGVTVIGERFLSWSLDGTVRSFTFDGEADRVIKVVDEEGSGGVDHLLALGDGSFVVVARQKARRFEAATGNLLKDHGEQTNVHALPGGRFLLENYGVFTLCGGEGAGLGFTVDPGNDHRVYPLDGEEILIPVRRSLEIVSLRDGSVRSGPTGHTKDLGGLVSLGEGRWVSHARSMPGLNERFGFDGTLRVWDAGAWSELGVHDFKAPIRALIALPEQRVAVLLDDAVRGKELPIYSARSQRLVQTIKGAKKAIAGALSLPGNKLFAWSRDGLARVISL